MSNSFRNNSTTRDRHLPWMDPHMVDEWKSEYNSASDEQKLEILYPYNWALVHSKRPDDVKLGIERLEVSLARATIENDPRQKKKDMYLLAVGHFRCGDYSRSVDLLDQCLLIKPGYWKAIYLKRKIKRDRARSTVIAATAMVDLVISLLAAVNRASYPTLHMYKMDLQIEPEASDTTTLKKLIINGILEHKVGICIGAIAALLGFVLAKATGDVDKKGVSESIDNTDIEKLGEMSEMQTDDVENVYSTPLNRVIDSSFKISTDVDKKLHENDEGHSNPKTTNATVGN
ncbi:mitochondrial fission 1 protein A [Tanacetum coccineum]